MERAVEWFVAVTAVAVGASHLLRPGHWADAFRRLHGCGRAGAFVNGGLSLAPGAAIVAGHGSWAWPGTVLTGFGWLLVAKGVACLVAPDAALHSMDRGARSQHGFVVAGLVLLAIGGWACYCLARGAPDTKPTGGGGHPSMGATSWRYYTPYRPDPEAALQALRADVFARGAYVDPTGPMEDRLRQTARRLGQDPDAPEVRGQIENSLRVGRAIETGDTRRLTPGDRSFVRRVREVQQLAARLGAAPPPRPGRHPRTIEELLEHAAECGTHSVLDIERVRPRAGFAVAAPLSPTAVRRAFGTAEPTHAQVEDGWADVAERLGRWQARYLTVYRDGQPHEYGFIGSSGD